LRDKNRLPLIGRKAERIVLTDPKIVLVKGESEQTLPISKRNPISKGNLAEDPAIKKIKEKFLLANIAAEPRVKNEEHTRTIHTTSVVTKMVIHLRCIPSTPTWARHQGRTRIINPRVMSNHQHLLSRVLTTMVANVIFAMIQIIWQTYAHKRASINKMLKQSFRQTKAF
jgi:hypothetical protein